MATEIKAYLYIKSTFAGVLEHFIECTTAIPFNIVGKSHEYTGNLPKLSVIFADKIFSPVQIRNFSEHLYQYFELDNSHRDHYPFLIVGNDFPDKDKKDSKINTHTLFNNSCIWFRCVGAEKLSENDFAELQAAIQFFETCNTLKLYEQPSAKEYLTYHVNIQKENYLKGNHKQIVPNRYASEVFDEKEGLQKKYNDIKNIGIRLLLIDDKIPCIENIGIRLLLIDDKIPCLIRHNELKPCEIKRDIECDNCKLRIVKELLSKKSDFCGYEPIWDTDENNIKAYTINKKDDISKIEKGDKVQIIGVNSIEFAKTIMADKSLKFDLILLDYYFHDNRSESYGTELLKFIETRQNKKVEKDTHEIKKEKEKKEELRQNMRQNAGLENRFWIFPITAFTDSFLTHLHSEGVPFLTSKSYIYTPTNPIVMPKRFLRNLNEFIGMMVDRSVYNESMLKKFFLITCEKFADQWELYKNSSEREKLVDLYVSLMGSEYRRFIQLYGARLNIARDKGVSLFAKSIWEKFYEKANIDDDEQFAAESENSYFFFMKLWNKIKTWDTVKKFFTTLPQTTTTPNTHNRANDISKAKLFTLNFLMRKFFYASTYLTDDRNGREKLRLAWIDLKSYMNNYFIEDNDKAIFDNFCVAFSELMEKMTNKQYDV